MIMNISDQKHLSYENLMFEKATWLDTGNYITGNKIFHDLTHALK